MENNKEEIIKLFKKELFNHLKMFDTPEKIREYIDKIDDEVTYQSILIDMGEPFNCTLEQAIERDCNYYYMLYPDY